MTGGRSAQAKGRKGEMELAAFLRDHGYQDARPGAALNYGKEPDVIGVDGLHIECKRREKLELNKWYKQSQDDAERMKDGLPVVIYRQNRHPWMIALSLADFIKLTGGKSDDGKSNRSSESL